MPLLHRESFLDRNVGKCKFRKGEEKGIWRKSSLISQMKI
jgi:hypothetical protein